MWKLAAGATMIALMADRGHVSDALDGSSWVSRRRRFGVAGAGAMYALVLLGVTLPHALATRGEPFPSFLVDPLGAYSLTGLPEWRAQEMARHAPGPRPFPGAAPTLGPTLPGALAWPDLVLAVDGEVILPEPYRSGNFASLRVAAAVRHRVERGAEAATITLRRGDEVFVVRAPLRRLGNNELVFLYGTYAFSGLFALSGGLMVLLIAGRRVAAGAYAFTATGIFTWLVSLYGYHVGAHLVPLLQIAMVWVSLGCLWLAWAFPDPPAHGRRLFVGLLLAASGLAGCAAVWFALAPLLGVWPWRSVRVLNVAFNTSVLTMALSPLVRLRGSVGRTRQELRAALVPITVGPSLVLAPWMLGANVFTLVAPLLVAVLPSGLGWAMVRHNIFATTMVLSRRLLVIPVLLLAPVAALFVWRATYGLLAAAGPERVLPVGWALVLILVLIMGARKLIQHRLFPATAHFRPSIEALTDQLATLRDPAAVRTAVAAAVVDSVPDVLVSVLDPERVGSVAHVPVDHAERLGRGEPVWTDETTWSRQLLLPMRSLGELRGVLLLGPKPDGAVYTADDLELLQTVASLGAVALHNVEVLAQIEALRRLEVTATRDERRLSLGLFGAEMSHEIAYPVNFFRYLLKRSAPGQRLDDQDVEVGREEVERLERMLATLRKLKTPPPRRERVHLAQTVNRALNLIRETLIEKGVRAEVDVPEDLTLIADRDSLLQVFTNLLRNGAQAVAEDGTIGVCCRRDDGGVTVEVWDSGPGIPEAIRDRLFDPWVTTHEGGSGLGLAITHRIVRDFGWTIGHDRVRDRTLFTIRVPREATASGRSVE